jgi:hypothetical protein
LRVLRATLLAIAALRPIEGHQGQESSQIADAPGQGSPPAVGAPAARCRYSVAWVGAAKVRSFT